MRTPRSYYLQFIKIVAFSRLIARYLISGFMGLQRVMMNENVLDPVMDSREAELAKTAQRRIMAALDLSPMLALISNCPPEGVKLRLVYAINPNLSLYSRGLSEPRGIS